MTHPKGVTRAQNNARRERAMELAREEGEDGSLRYNKDEISVLLQDEFPSYPVMTANAIQVLCNRKGVPLKPVPRGSRSHA